MRRTIRAALGENARDLGVLRFAAQGARESTAFEYNKPGLAAPDRFAVDPGLPLVTGPQCHRSGGLDRIVTSSRGGGADDAIHEAPRCWWIATPPLRAGSR